MNSNEIHYFGDAASFQILFAQGGAGIVVSHEALKKLVANKEKCAKKFDNVVYGDAILALCLNEIGIHFQNSKIGKFEVNPPTSFGDPCDSFISFHHLLPYQMQILYNVEMHVRKTYPGTLVNNYDLYRGFVNQKRNTTFVVEKDTTETDSITGKRLDYLSMNVFFFANLI